MIQDIGAHGCIEQTPSGAFRSSIGYTKLDEVCQRCGAKITEQYFHKVTLRPTEQSQDEVRQPKKRRFKSWLLK